MSDIRCKKCNWLNREVQESFICKNCGKENTIKIKIEEQIIKKSAKDYE